MASSPNSETRRLVIAGCGYTGRALALAHSGPVTGIVRSAEGEAQARSSGIDVLRADLRTGVADDVTAGADIAYLAPPPGSGERDPVLEGFLAGRITAPHRIVYTSTSGVYGDCGGERVDEDRPPAPQTGRALRRLAAENALREWCAANGTEWVILRVAGIYGPDRLPLARLHRREPVLDPRDAGPGNRIHRDDLVRVLAAALRTPHTARVFNVSDGNHASGTEFVQRVAALAGLAPPATMRADEAQSRFSAKRWSFLAESRRLDNRRMREVLGVEPRYTDLDAGIRASLREG